MLLHELSNTPNGLQPNLNQSIIWKAVSSTHPLSLNSQSQPSLEQCKADSLAWERHTGVVLRQVCIMLAQICQEHQRDTPHTPQTRYMVKVVNWVLANESLMNQSKITGLFHSLRHFRGFFLFKNLHSEKASTLQHLQYFPTTCTHSSNQFSAVKHQTHSQHTAVSAFSLSTTKQKGGGYWDTLETKWRWQQKGVTAWHVPRLTMAFKERNCGV